MITFAQLGNVGKFGNQLFEIAGTIGLAKRYNTTAGFPKWKYSSYFKNPLPKMEPCMMGVQEKHYRHDWEQWDEYKELLESMNVDISGYLQSSKYWDKEDIIKQFELSPEFLSWLLPKYEEVFSKPVIAISIRRGDYVNNPNYELLPPKYVIGALLEHFPDKSHYNILIFSDDINYCKIHFDCLPNVYYAGGSEIEDHALMRQCDHFITANSTFSYWGAYLGRKPHSKIICPKYLFAGPLLEKYGDINFYEPDWTVFDHKPYKINLADTTFMIPCYNDSGDRDENISLSIKLLKDDFDCKIIVGENQTRSFSHLGDRYMKFDYPEFHRTRMLNQMAQKATTPIIVNWDCDVIVPPMQLVEATRLAKSGYDIIYPYGGKFARVPRTHYNDLDKSRDVGVLKGQFKGTELTHNSVGGAVVYNRESFFKAGGENENFVTYGPEDQERFYRFQKLGFRVRRVPGILYHIDHEMTINSTTSHPLYKSNRAVFENMKKMSTQELKDYVESWDFTSSYPETYHDQIYDNKSRDAVYALLDTQIDFKSIIDVGCGNGSWNDGKRAYTGVDHNMRVNAPWFVEADIRKPLDLPKADLVISLEVAEHVEEKYVDTLIDNLCKLGDKVLFSAAIPRQDGENHLNCQWQSYWAAKFKERGFQPFYKDIRTPLWHNQDVAAYYRQNMVLYSKYLPTLEYELDKVHPEMYLSCI